MKHLMYFQIVLFAIISVTGCSKRSTLDNSDAAFAQRLQEISKRTNLFFQEKSASQNSINMDKVNTLLDDAAEIMTEFNISEKVQLSGYYSSLTMPSTKSSDQGQDLYSTILAQSSDCFQGIINDYLKTDALIQIEDVIQEKELLDNEKIALAYMISFLHSEENTDVKSSSGCREAYNSSMKGCKKWMYIGLGLSVASAFVSGFLSAAFAAATTLDYDNCSSAANDAYLDCMGL